MNDGQPQQVRPKTVAPRLRYLSNNITATRADPGLWAGAAEYGRTVSVPRALAYVTIVAVAILFLWLTLPVDFVIFAGVILAICLRRAADCAARILKAPIGLAIVVILFAAITMFAGFCWFFSQQIAGQVDLLMQQLPAAAEKVAAQIRPYLDEHLDLSQTGTSPLTIVEGFFGAAANIVEIVGGFVMMLFLGLYFAVEADLYLRGMLRLVPPARRQRAAEIMHETAGAIWFWMLGRAFSMAVLGSLTTIGLWGLGVPAPVALGVLAGLLTFVPYLGAILSAVPSLLLAAAVDLHLAIYVAALYVGVHAVEAYLLVPLVQRHMVHVPPALGLANQVLLGVLGGFLGLLLATPLLAAGLVVVRMVYVEDLLGDRQAAPPPARPG